MRIALYAAALVALAASLQPSVARGALATSASTLVEATPLLLGATLAARVLSKAAIVEYLGCGCAAGPSARSLPATVAAWIVFGPAVAVARFAAAVGAAAWLRAARRCDACPHQLGLLAELESLLPAALLAGACGQLSAAFDLQRLPPVAAAAAGAALGFAAAPCGLGAVAVAGALRAHAPLAAASFLCVAGICDLRALHIRPHNRGGHDALAYAVLACALAIVAARRGDALVHPLIAKALFVCAVAASAAGILHRRKNAPALRFAPLVILLGALVSAPPPQYRATETTLADLFPGERLSFTGALTRQGGASAIVRYAITCCRADASPVVVRLTRTPPFAPGQWLRVEGTIAGGNGAFALVPQRITPIAPPTDPFVYR